MSEDWPPILAETVEATATAILRKAWGRARGMDSAGMPHTLYGDPMPAERAHAEKTAEVALQAALPAILKQERQRVREGLDRLRALVEEMARESCELQSSAYINPSEASCVGPPPAFDAVLAVLDTLEDSDG
jgi:hypothetical protein